MDRGRDTSEEAALHRLDYSAARRMFRQNEKPGCDTGPIANMHFVKQSSAIPNALHRIYATNDC
jgi:hypothetical protein